MRTILKLVLIPLVAVLFSSCSNEKDHLTDMIEDAWDEIGGDIESSAEEALEDYADNPAQLYSGDCETDYISLGDIFTLKIPIDHTSNAVIGLLFGSDAANFMSLVENSNRSSKSKS